MSHRNPSYDILIVGAGFSGITLLHTLRQHGYASCRIYESGSDLGGVWHSTAYPGCRVDTEGSIYQLSIPEVYSTFSFREKYPSADEMRRYFAHVERVLDVKKDVEFGVTVAGAWFDAHAEGERKWRVETGDGRVTHCRFLILCVGSSSERYIPDIPGLGTFKGQVCHSAEWPRGGVDVAGKKVAVIGTGASGVQIIQSWAKEAGNLVVFQRTPNLALPMQQEALSPEAQRNITEQLPRIFADRQKTWSGYLDESTLEKTFDASPEAREAHFEALYKRGGFAFYLAGYSDLLTDEAANREAYNFWLKKTRARITDPWKRDILAPLEPPHPAGAKRSSFEQDYFEQFNRLNVQLVNLREPGQAIRAVRSDGIEVEDGTVYPVDVIALATGFNSLTGSLTCIPGLRNTSGVTLAEEWSKDGASTYLGLTRRGYPNMFLCYSVHGPAALSNGPASIEIQAKWIVDAIRKIDESGLSYIKPTEEAEKTWKATVNMITSITLFPKADSWYMGANIPGKKREMLNFPGGLPMYEQMCRKALENWEGFVTV
jgi:cation diffusion facilitator CzcD-associated flavoprotein CzcO